MTNKYQIRHPNHLAVWLNKSPAGELFSCKIVNKPNILLLMLNDIWSYVLQKERRCYSCLQIFSGYVWSKSQNISQMDRRHLFYILWVFKFLGIITESDTGIEYDFVGNVTRTRLITWQFKPKDKNINNYGTGLLKLSKHGNTDEGHILIVSEEDDKPKSVQMRYIKQ